MPFSRWTLPVIQIAVLAFMIGFCAGRRPDPEPPNFEKVLGQMEAIKADIADVRKLLQILQAAEGADLKEGAPPTIIRDNLFYGDPSLGLYIYGRENAHQFD